MGRDETIGADRLDIDELLHPACHLRYVYLTLTALTTRSFLFFSRIVVVGWIRNADLYRWEAAVNVYTKVSFDISSCQSVGSLTVAVIG